MATNYRRNAATIVINDQGEVLLQKRAEHDNVFPAHWDFSAGGGVDENENTQAATERELREELGIRATIELLRRERFTYPAWEPGTMLEVDLALFTTRHNGPFQPDPSEVHSVVFFSLKKIKSMLASGEKFHAALALAIEKDVLDAALR